jgi:signal transduction histidine kinase
VASEEKPSVGSGSQPAAEALAALNALVRHHVRNNLLVIRGRAQLLSTGDAGAEPDIETIVRRCDELADTVAKIEQVTTAMQGDIDPDPLDLVAFLRVELAALSERFTVAVERDLPETGPAVLADDTLGFVLRELIDNVQAHTDAESVRISVTADEGRAYLLVADDGPGLPPAVAKDPFGHGVSGPSTGGGLGLFLCRTIVSAYGGSIGFDDREDGTTVRVALPLAER